MAISVTMLALRVVEAIFAIIVLGISAYLSHSLHENYETSVSQFNFLIFTSIWTLLALIYLTLTDTMLAHSALGHKFVVLAVEALTALFWFAGWVATATLLGRSAECYGGYCSAAKAATVFAALEWAVFMATLVLTALAAFRGGRGVTNPKVTNAGPALVV